MPRQQAPQGSKAVGQQPIEEDEGFRWAVMGVIGFLPLFNWMAWVFGALEDESRARLYYWYAALYALPLLRSGFDFDWFTITMLVTGMAHIQMERIAATEPDTQAALAAQLRPLAVVRTLASATSEAASTAFGASSSTSKHPGALPPGEEGGRSFREATGSEPEEGSRSAEEDYELERFDLELQDRERRRRRKQGGGQ